MAISNEIEPKSGKTYKELFEENQKKNKKPKVKADIKDKKNPALDDRESDFEFKNAEMVIFQPNNSLMAKDRLNERDLTPQKTFFFYHLKRKKKITYTEAEASLMMKSNHAQFLEQLGCSDGSTYRKYIQNCGVKPGDRIPREKAEEILRKAREAEFEAAKGNFQVPKDNSVHFDPSFPVEQRAGFTPPK